MSFCSSDNQAQMNRQLYERNVPSQMLQPYLDVRPLSTKYTFLPIVDPRVSIKTPLIQQPTYNIKHTFNPGNTKGPWSGFSSQVEEESSLRNQYFALQKCNQAVYVPNSDSDLYKAPVFLKKSDDVLLGKTPFLFQEETYLSPNSGMGEKKDTSLFLNNTRMQRKEGC